MAVSDPPVFKRETGEVGVIRGIEGDERELMGMSNRGNLAISERWRATEGDQTRPLTAMPLGGSFIIGQHRDGRANHVV